jgi:hypothetical protein
MRSTLARINCYFADYFFDTFLADRHQPGPGPKNSSWPTDHRPLANFVKKCSGNETLPEQINGLHLLPFTSADLG